MDKDFVPVRLSDLKEWRESWLEQNEPEELGTDIVTPFDCYLYGWPQPAPKPADAAGYTTGPTSDGGVDPRVEPGYEWLATVLQAALDQAQYGKGKERHANDRPFHEQRMQTLSDALNSAKGMAFQACKKITEGVDHPTYEQQERELLGAIVYISGMIIWLKRHQQ